MDWSKPENRLPHCPWVHDIQCPDGLWSYHIVGGPGTFVEPNPPDKRFDSAEEAVKAAQPALYAERINCIQREIRRLEGLLRRMQEP
jgi:hypothetical protein